MLQAVNLAKREIRPFDFPGTIAGARVVWVEELRSKCISLGKDASHWDKHLEDAHKQAKAEKAEEEFMTWLRTKPGLADRIMSIPYGDKVVRF